MSGLAKSGDVKVEELPSHNIDTCKMYRYVCVLYINLKNTNGFQLQLVEPCVV